jgi:hypothetical protein
LSWPPATMSFDISAVATALVAADLARKPQPKSIPADTRDDVRIAHDSLVAEASTRTHQNQRRAPTRSTRLPRHSRKTQRGITTRNRSPTTQPVTEAPLTRGGHLRFS